MLRFTFPIMVVPFGLVVRIPGFHPGGPGSIPGMGTTFIFLTTFLKFFSLQWKHIFIYLFRLYSTSAEGL